MKEETAGERRLRLLRETNFTRQSETTILFQHSYVNCSSPEKIFCYVQAFHFFDINLESYETDDYETIHVFSKYPEHNKYRLITFPSFMTVTKQQLYNTLKQVILDYNKVEEKVNRLVEDFNKEEIKY